MTRNKKFIIIIFILLLIVFLVKGFSVSETNSDLKNEIVYVKQTHNILVIIFRYIDKCISFLVGGFFKIVGKLFELIFSI